MSGESKTRMHCAEFEGLLVEALDGTLNSQTMEKFDEHKASCATCAPLFAEAEQGLSWLKSLDEVEPPAKMVRSIMRATVGVESASRAAEVESKSFVQRMRDLVQPIFAPVMTPRFAMSFGMAFFSISMLLNVSGVRIGDVRRLDLTPRGMSKTYYETQAKVVKYYDNMRVVYEVTSKVRDLRRAAASDETKQDNKGTEQNENKTKSKEPERNQYENYSQDGNRLQWAVLRDSDLAGSGLTRRES
jgi:hypothetical protein